MGNNGCGTSGIPAHSSIIKTFLRVLFSLQKHQLMDLATGSIGQGLGVACGMAYTGKYFDRAR